MILVRGVKGEPGELARGWVKKGRVCVKQGRRSLLLCGTVWLRWQWSRVSGGEGRKGRRSRGAGVYNRGVHRRGEGGTKSRSSTSAVPHALLILLAGCAGSGVGCYLRGTQDFFKNFTGSHTYVS